MWLKKIMTKMMEKENMSYEFFNDKIKKAYSLEKYKEKLMEKTDKFFEQREIKSKFFAICFSGMESEDMLSQWRGYGDDGKGVAIAFDEDIIKKTRKKIVFKQEKNKIQFKKVEYDIEKQKQIIKEFWAEQVKIANQSVREVNIDFEFWLITSFYNLYGDAIFMKNPFFREENESRIVLEIEEEPLLEMEDRELANKIKIKEGQMAIRNGNIVKYYDLDISELMNGFIRKIILGPKCKVDKEDIEMLLKKEGYKNVDVDWSKGSYQ